MRGSILKSVRYSKKRPLWVIAAAVEKVRQVPITDMLTPGDDGSAYATHAPLRAE